MTNKSRPEVYIGDGVYASFDGMHIWLRTERASVFNPTQISVIQNVIALDASVFASLRDYAERVWPKEELT